MGVRAWLDDVLGRRPRYRAVAMAAVVECRPGEAVELRGVVEVDESGALLHDPLTGAPAVVLRYEATPPTITERYFGLNAETSRYASWQATDFILRAGEHAVRVELAPGGRVDELHARLSAEHGVRLEVEVERIAPGDRITVRGRIGDAAPAGSPHRREPWTATIHADEFDDDGAQDPPASVRA